MGGRCEHGGGQGLSSGGVCLGAGGSGPQPRGEVEVGKEGGDQKMGAPRGAGERAEWGVRSHSSPGLASVGCPCTCDASHVMISITVN